MCLPTRFCLGIFAAAALAISPAIAQCDDHNSCTSDALVDGVCVHTPVLEGTYCPELYGPCTRSPFCHAGQCNPGPIDDHNSCTTDTFVDGVCVLTPVPDGTFCVEGYKFCTQFPRCEAGYCDSGPITDCDDGNPCTDDFCGLLCRHIQLPNGTPCDDGISCTINEHCSYGACVAGGTTACPTDNPCTFGVCGHNGCEIYNRDSHVACDDGDPCTVETCDPESGVHTSVCTVDATVPTTVPGSMQFLYTGTSQGATPAGQAAEWLIRPMRS